MPVDLTKAKDDVLKRFNALDYDGLVKVMHPDIVLKRVLHDGSIAGIGNVKAYLLDYMLPLNPSFDILGEVTFYPKATADQEKAMRANVSGTGDYHDENGKQTTRVLFVWTFTRDDFKKDWLLSNAFGAPVPPK